jgi:hypothetical protein
MTTQNIYQLTDTWNSAGTTFTGIGLSVTDTASASGSLLMDFTVGTTFLTLRKNGLLTLKGNESEISIGYPAETNLLVQQGGLINSSSGAVSWSSSATAVSGANRDLILARDAANTLAQRNGTNAQAFRVYNTYTDASNYERGIFRWVGNFLEIGTEAAGTGSTRAILLATGGATRWNIGTAGHLTAGVDDTYDIGASGATRPRTLYLANTLVRGGASYSSTLDNSGLLLAGPSGGPATLRLNETGMTAFTLSPVASTANTMVFAGANTYQVRNGTSAQTFQIYNTYTDASNYERLGITWATNVCTIATLNAGTGTARELALFGAAALRLGGNGASNWVINSSGHFLAQTDATYDIGASGANRPRNVYISGNTQLGSAGIFGWASRSLVDSPSDGVVRFTNAATTDFGRLQFGGTTSSFPSLKRSSTTLQARLADDSAFAPVQGKLTTDTAYTAGDPVTTGYLTLYDSNGTAYKVPAVAV